MDNLTDIPHYHLPKLIFLTSVKREALKEVLGYSLYLA
ncbi:hypothetical protein D019_0806 [Vibrio parahaemolyticus VP2007-095]|nr:hypothetical protein D019_0806 [Vibrio parahaemolyticus VP2007-095]